MRLLWIAASACAALTLTQSKTPYKPNHDLHNYHVVEVKKGGSIVVVAAELGVELVDQVGELEDVWLVKSPKFSGDLVRRDEDPVINAYHSLRDRAHLTSRSDSELTTYESIVLLEREIPEELEKRAPPPVNPPPLSATVALQGNITDPLFPRQWHLANDAFPEHMMNVSGLWKEGLTGKGVVTSLIDDGLDYESEDLKINFDADDSYDFNDYQHLPTPKNERDHHGTRCAGQIAAVKNEVCGVGIAFNARVAGVRILGGKITKSAEARALNYGFQNVSIYSCSWGPRDDATKLQGPSYIIQKAVLNGINQGRGGKGSIFVFASGNGGHKGDQCNFDGYTNSIYSVTVGAVDYKGHHPRYSEACTANMIVAYSSGSGNHIVTTDKGKNNCATTHGGTSAAAPNVVGVFALAVQARPDLTWRDMQYLCVETARPINTYDPSWSRIANGKYYSSNYGFGVLDGWHYVQAAKTWKLVKPQAWVESPVIQLKNGTMDIDGYFDGGELIDVGGANHTMTFTKEMLVENNFETLEHITVRVWIDHTNRGEVEVEITSPTGIKSVLGSKRERDKATTGYPGWVFMSVKHWGDNPVGNWTIKVSDQENEETGYFVGWSMSLWGTTIDPSKAKKYEVQNHDYVLPFSNNGTVVPSRPTIGGSEHPGEDDGPSRIHGKPTTGLPHDPSFPGPSNNDGWLADLTSSKQKWLVGIVAFIILLNFAGAIYYCRRHFNLWGTDDPKAYTALPGAEVMPMTNLQNPSGTAPQSAGGMRLYDVLEEEETTALAAGGAGATTTVAGPHPQARSTGGLGFHSGFLDDDDPVTAVTPKYRDADDDEAGPSRVGPPPQPLQPPAPAASHHQQKSDGTSEEETSSEEDGVLWDDARAK